MGACKQSNIYIGETKLGDRFGELLRYVRLDLRELGGLPPLTSYTFFLSTNTLSAPLCKMAYVDNGRRRRWRWKGAKGSGGEGKESGGGEEEERTSGQEEEE